MADHSRPDVEPLAGCADLGPESGAVGQDTTFTVRLRPTNWLHRAAWWTHVVVAVGLGLFGGAVAVLVSIVLIFDAVTTTACESATPAPPNFTVDPFAFDPEARARKFVESMANDEFQTAYEMLAQEAWGTESYCAVSLERFWNQAAELDGARLVAVNQPDSGSFAPVFNRLEIPLRLTVESGGVLRDVYLDVSFLADGRIAGVEFDSLMTDVGRDQFFPPPPYADPDGLQETDVTLGEAPWDLTGTLTLPTGSGPFPAVVLVGGRDRDGTGPTTKLTRDRAWGLAAHGVASLRVDRRTHAHALATARLKEFTIDDELVDDMLAAVELLRRTPRIDPGRIYVMGGSLAGFATPMVGLRDPTIAGVIIAVAPSGLLHDVAWRQRQLRTGLDGEVTSLEQRLVQSAKARSEAVSAWLRGQGEPRDMAVHRSYYEHLGTYRPEDAAYRLLMPIFVISVDRDRIVPPEDAETWIRTLGLRRNVAFRLYRGHNHSLIDERGFTESTAAEGKYASWQVISDIATWIDGGWTDRWCTNQQNWFAGCRGG